MAIGWFICLMKEEATGSTLPVALRWCAISDLGSLYQAEGGRMHFTEVLGNHCIVKVKASEATLATIAATEGVTRIPLSRLDDSLSTLSNAQRTALRNKVLGMGYTASEVNAAFPDLKNATLGEVLRFCASRRLKPRWDAVNGVVVLDGAVQPCVAISDVDGEVTE